ncbi:MAG: PP2C family protein-serine/threonine phosphatase [Candidatus Flexifilum sp.]
MSDAYTRKLELELESMTAALAHAWDQLVPLLSAVPNSTGTSTDVVSLIESILSALDTSIGAIYLDEGQGRSAGWYATPSHVLTQAEFEPHMACFADQQRVITFHSVSPFSGNEIAWWFVPLYVEMRLAGALGVGFEGREHELTASELKLLARMSERMAGTLVASHLEQSRAREARIAHEIEIAGLIQRSIQPLLYPDVRGLQLAADWRPAATVAGDAWGWVIQPGGELACFVLDIAGKGLPSSLWAVSLRSALNMALRLGLDPAEVIQAVNDEVYEGFTAAGLLATVTVCRVNPRTHRFEQANAGHPPTLLCRGHGWERLAATSPPLGVLPVTRPRIDTVQLAPGDLVVCYSDGLTELPTPDGMWGEAGITAQIEAICDSPAQVIVDQIMSRAQAEAVLAPQDDITLLVVRMVDGGGM